MSGINIGNAPISQETDTEKGMIEKLTAQEVAALDKGTCPDCGGHKFLEGPHGGVSVNIMCDGCGAKFNIVPGLGGSFGKERIGRPTKRISNNASI